MSSTVTIRPDGTVTFLHDDSLAELLALGEVEINRASHVEWGTIDGVSGWCADLAPVGGPILGPFSHRATALAAEREWIENWMASSDYAPPQVLRSDVQPFKFVRRYDWKKYFDGRPWRLKQGVHFYKPRASFKSSAHHHARRLGLDLITRMHGEDEIDIQVIGTIDCVRAT